MRGKRGATNEAVRRSLIGVLVVAGSLLSPAMAGAATLTITTTADNSISTRLCTLRDAITSANTDANSGPCVADGSYGDDTINITATGTIDLESQLPDLDSNMVLDGPGAAVLDVHRQSGGDYRIFRVTAGRAVTIADLSVTNGKTATGGAGISNSGDLRLVDVRVAGNHATTAGDRGAGGGGILNLGTLTMVNSTASGNSLSVPDPAQPGDTWAFGGGIENFTGMLVVQGSTVSENTASATSSDPGGSVWASGGGIANSTGTVTVRQSTVTGNSVSTPDSGLAEPIPGAGGIGSNRPIATTLTLVGDTVAFNSGGQIANLDASLGQDTVRNTIVSNPQGGGANCSGTVESSSFNIAFPTGCTGMSALSADPLLQPLADNAGPTLTHGLGANSPALDAGIALIESLDQRGLTRTVDLSIPNAGGGDGTDIGAIEAQDDDADGIATFMDNCPFASNSDQADNDGDGQGDRCDPDDDNDAVADTADSCDFIAAATPSGCPAVGDSLSLRYSRATHGFRGRLATSPASPPCMTGAEVTVYKRRRGPDRKLGTVMTSSSGRYLLKRSRRIGRYYAKAPTRLIPDAAACGAAKSRRITIR